MGAKIDKEEKVPLLDDSIELHNNQAQGTSLTTTTINLVALGFGTGLLVLPWGSAGASLVVSYIVNAIV